MNGFQGLTEDQAKKLAQEFGPNVIASKEGDSRFLILLDQLKSPLIYILIVIAFFSAFLGNFEDVVLIGLVVVLNSAMGFFQEYKAQKIFIALKGILKPSAIVIRDGRRKEIEVSQLVPGDIVVLGSGDKVPADGILLEAVNLLANEAILTGEEESVQKSLNENSNKLFMGTSVLSGRGFMKVEKIGAKTEIGKIGKNLAQIKETKTPIKIKLEKLSKDLVWLILFVCLFIFLAGVWRGAGILETLRLSVVLVIAAIPEGLPVVITIILALGAGSILKRKGLVKKMVSIETLGASSVICTDKTGTLTEGDMRVVKTDFIEKDAALEAIVLTNAQRTNIDMALWQHAQKESSEAIGDILKKYERIHEEPFDSHKKYIFVVAGDNGFRSGFLAGAPEIILDFCKNSPNEKDLVLKQISDWAREGLKLIGLAKKKSGDFMDKTDFEWVGLAGIEDPIRKEAKDAIRQAQEAGIEVKIVTGDYRGTAERIAANLGFNFSSQNVVEGKELEALKGPELSRRIGEAAIFARVTPFQKQTIIDCLQKKGETVAMTGDGVNDALALKKADIGVVLETGSEVAKEAGDLILLDNNFKTIVAAIEEGRAIFANIKKAVAYVLSNSFVEIFLIFGSMLLQLPYPLGVAQILWIHLICDGPPDIMLCFEKKEPGLMKEKPQDLKKADILSNSLKFLILSISLVVGSACLSLFWASLKLSGNLELARTFVFASVASVDLIYVFSFRNLNQSIFKSGYIFENKFLVFGVLYGFILTFAAVYVPFLNRILGTVPLRPIHWVFVLGLGIAGIFLTEIFKFIFFSKKSKSYSA